MNDQLLTLRLTGVAPLLLHNGQTADPMNYYSKLIKAISSKRSKVDADYEEMARIEWFASLYLIGPEKKIGLPGEVLEACLINGAKKFKLGMQAKSSLYVPDAALLEFDGDDLTAEELWARGQNTFTAAVRVNQSKVMRTRAIFNEWKLSFRITNLGMNESDILKIIKKAGEEVGLCEWRPRLGRFTAELG